MPITVGQVRKAFANCDADEIVKLVIQDGGDEIDEIDFIGVAVRELPTGSQPYPIIDCLVEMKEEF